MYYLDENIKNLNRIFDQNKRQGYLRLDLNENPGGLPQEFVNEALSEVDPEFVAQYPETLEFTEVLADYLGTDIEHLCLVNGSAEGIRYIIEAFTAPGGEIVGVTPTYAMFEVYSKMYGRHYTSVQYTEDLKMPISRILDKLNASVQLLILSNPNNPLGDVYTKEEFETILETCEKFEITVLVDEAYHYFYPVTFMEYALTREHVFVTRTCSKLFSLAGCRLGYVAGSPEGVRMVQKLCTPHNVNAFAMLFAKKIIKTPGMIEKLTERQLAGKRYLLDTLREHGYQYNGGEGNFIFLKPKKDADEIVKRMKEEKGVLVKSYNGIGVLGKVLRVSTGEKQYMERFLQALFELDGEE